MSSWDGNWIFYLLDDQLSAIGFCGSYLLSQTTSLCLACHWVQLQSFSKVSYYVSDSSLSYFYVPLSYGTQLSARRQHFCVACHTFESANNSVGRQDLVFLFWINNPNWVEMWFVYLFMGNLKTLEIFSLSSVLETNTPLHSFSTLSFVQTVEALSEDRRSVYLYITRKDLSDFFFQENWYGFHSRRAFQLIFS